MSSKKHNLTLYLGIYNGEKYIDSLFEQIQSQENQNFKILVVDNNSSDRSRKMFGKWEKIYKNDFQFIQNKVNYGGGGSLFKNLDKVQTPWFCTLHQDDFYKPNHVSTIIDLISSSEKNIVGVSTTMGSMSNSGKVLNSKPRATWFSNSLDDPGQFLQNLKSQAIPFPATAFKLSVFKKTVVPFHSSTFSDTEQTLKMLAYGKFVISQKETMYYRENLNSESHSLNSKEIIIGSAIALSRIVASNEFKLLLDKIDKKKRGRFALQFQDALLHRLPRGDLLVTLQISSLEIMLESWGYQQKNVSKILLKRYREFASNQTLDTISNLSQIDHAKISFNHSSKKPKTNFAAHFWDIYFEINLGIFKKYNRTLLSFIYNLIFIIKPKHRFKNIWK